MKVSIRDRFCRHFAVRVLVVAIVCLFVPLAAPACAEYPDRPVSLIVPWDAGGSTDQTARVLAKAAERFLGQPIVVINKPGASSTLGMSELAAARPDGYTIGTYSTTAYLIPLRGRSVPYDPVKSFTPISYYGEQLVGIATLSGSRWNTLKDLIEEGKAHPNKLKYGTGGVGSPQHLTMEALSQATGAKFIHVPQKGAAGVMPALLGKHVDFISETSVWAPHVEAKSVRLLAVATERRLSNFSSVPTVHEFGIDAVQSRIAIAGPAGLPEPVRQKLEKAFVKATKDEAFRETMKRLSMEVVDLPGAAVRPAVTKEMEHAKALLEKLGLVEK